MSHFEIAVRLTPKAKADEIVGLRDGVLLVKVSAPPVDGKANAALCRLLAKRLGVARGRVTVVRGASARDKLVRIDGAGLELMNRRLGFKPEG